MQSMVIKLHFRLFCICCRGIKCGNRELPGVYVNVAKFLDWINETINTRDWRASLPFRCVVSCSVLHEYAYHSNISCLCLCVCVCICMCVFHANNIHQHLRLLLLLSKAINIKNKNTTVEYRGWCVWNESAGSSLWLNYTVNDMVNIQQSRIWLRSNGTHTVRVTTNYTNNIILVSSWCISLYAVCLLF